MKHIVRICPCSCGWIHLTEECPEIPYQPPKEEEPEYQVGPCWSFGQGHFARTCPDVETSAKKINKFNTKHEETQDSYEEETIPYHVEITKPQMIGGHLYRPGSGVLKVKTKVDRPIYLVNHLKVHLEENKHLIEGVHKDQLHLHHQINLKVILGVVEEVLQVGDLQAKDLQVVMEEVVMIIIMKMMIRMMKMIQVVLKNC